MHCSLQSAGELTSPRYITLLETASRDVSAVVYEHVWLMLAGRHQCYRETLLRSFIHSL